jgi:hypothetical protein
MADKKLSEMSFQELEDLCERSLARLARAANEVHKRTCSECEGKKMDPAVNIAATEFYSDVLRAKASGTRLATFLPDVTVQFGGK